MTAPAPPPDPRLEAPARPRAFAAYLGTQASWFFAFGVQTTMFPFLAAGLLNASGAQLGIAQGALTAPSLLLLMLGGVMAERLDRRRLLQALHALAALPPLGLAAVVTADALTYGALLVYGVAMGVIGALMMPTRDAALNAAAAAHGRLPLQRAVVWASLVQFLGQIAGMALAGGAALWASLRAGGAETAGVVAVIAPMLTAQAVMLAAGGAAASLLPPLRPAAGGASARAGVGRQLLEGVSVVWRAPVIRSMALAMVGVGIVIIGGGFMVLLPRMVVDLYAGGLAMLGAVFIVFWVGAAAATAALARYGQVRRPGRTLALTFFVGGASMGIFAADVPFAWVVAVVAVWGASAGIGIAMSRSIVQEAAPPEALARVLSIYQLGFMGGAPIGAVLMGVATDAFGLRAGAVLLTIGALACGVWIGLISPVGRLRGPARPTR